MRMDYVGFPMHRPICDIFVQTELICEGLNPIEYQDAEKRGKEAYHFFKDDLKFWNVRVHTNLTKL